MNDRELLHWVIDQLPEARLDEARESLGRLLEDPVLRLLMTAPVDDEPLLPAEAEALLRARGGTRHTQEEVNALLGRADRRLVG